MSLRFTRRIRIVPGLRLNLSKRGASVSIGHRGAWYTVGTSGQRATVGLPGSGLYWTEHVPPSRAHHDGHSALFIVAVAGLVLFALAALSHG